MAAPDTMWQCRSVHCGSICNPDKGDRKGKVPAGTAFTDLPETWRCPVRGASRKAFKSPG